MKDHVPTYKKSILYKLILVFLIIIVPFFTLNLIINVWGAENLKMQISKSTAKQVEFYLGDFESEIRNILEMQGLFLDEQDFKSLAYNRDDLSISERIFISRNIFSRLNQLKSLSPCINETFAFFPYYSIVLNNEGRTTFFDNNKFSKINNSNSFPFIYEDNELYLAISHKKPGYMAKPNQIFTITVHLSRQYIEETMLDFLPYKTGSSMLSCPEQGWAVTNEEDESKVYSMKGFCRENFMNPVDTTISSVKVNGEKYLAISKYSDFLDTVLAVYISEKEILTDYMRYSSWLWLLSAFAILVIVLFSYTIYRMIVKPLSKLLAAFRKVDEGELDIGISCKSNDEFKHLYNRFNQMVIKLKDLISVVYEKDLRAQKATLKQLQYQINPHFLYNSIFMVNSMAIAQDYDNIIRFTEHLGNFYKFITRSAANEIPLKSEVAHAKNYVEIQTFRFANRIRTVFDEIPKECENLIIPRLTLQPIIENAFEHGLKNKKSDGSLGVTICKEANALLLYVNDNGGDMNEEKLNMLKDKLSSSDEDVEYSGIVNVHRRLQLKYGPDSGISVSINESGGLCVEIKIVMEE